MRGMDAVRTHGVDAQGAFGFGDLEWAGAGETPELYDAYRSALLQLESYASSSREKALDVLQIMMINRAFIACISFSVGMFMSGFFDLEVAALVSLAIIATYSSQAVYNCIKDIEGDKINAPWQPLASGRLSTGFAWTLMGFLIALGLVFFWLANHWFVLLGIAFDLLGIFYSAYAKGRHFVSYVTLVSTHMAIPLAAGYLLVGHPDLRLAIAIAFIYMTEVLSMSIKDYKDVQGDQEMGLRTLPVVLGTRKASLLTFAGFCSPLLLSWIPWLLLHTSLVFLVASVSSGVARLCLGLYFVAQPTPDVGSTTLKKFRYVRIAQMLTWCLI